MPISSRKLVMPILAAAILFTAGVPSSAVAAPGHLNGVERALNALPGQVQLVGDRRRSHSNGYVEFSFGRRHHFMGPRQVRRSLRHKGFSNIRIIRQRGSVYVARAVGWRGRPVRVVVDGYTGQIVRIRPSRRGHHWSYRW